MLNINKCSSLLTLTLIDYFHTYYVLPATLYKTTLLHVFKAVVWGRPGGGWGMGGGCFNADYTFFTVANGETLVLS